jgi:hypothetical protein
MLGRSTCASVIVIVALAAAPALAQQDQHHPTAARPPAGMAQGRMMQGMPGGGMAGAGGAPMMGMMGMMMGRANAMAGHVEGRLAFLKTELKITPVQLPLWNKFAAAVRENAKAMGGMMRSSMMQGGMMGTHQSASLPDRLARRVKLMSAHLEALRRLQAVADPLYAALSDKQKKAADQLRLGPMGMM